MGAEEGMRIYKTMLMYGVQYELPKYLNVINFEVQGTHPTMWYLFDDTEPETFNYELRILHTGAEVPDDIDCWLGTILGPDGLVFHYFLKRV